MKEWPYCDVLPCKHYKNCQSEKSIMIRILRDDDESKPIFESCQKITRRLIELKEPV